MSAAILALLVPSRPLSASCNKESKHQTALLTTCLLIRSSRLALFKQELAEREELDILDRASLKAHHSKINGVLSAPEYHRVVAKIDSLKKLRFTEDYERLQDPATYEWMKYKVAAEVGGHEEKAAF